MVEQHREMVKVPSLSPGVVFQPIHMHGWRSVPSECHLECKIHLCLTMKHNFGNAPKVAIQLLSMGWWNQSSGTHQYENIPTKSIPMQAHGSAAEGATQQTATVVSTVTENESMQESVIPPSEEAPIPPSQEQCCSLQTQNPIWRLIETIAAMVESEIPRMEFSASLIYNNEEDVISWHTYAASEDMETIYQHLAMSTVMCRHWMHVSSQKCGRHFELRQESPAP